MSKSDFRVIKDTAIYFRLYSLVAQRADVCGPLFKEHFLFNLVLGYLSFSLSIFATLCNTVIGNLFV